MTEEKNPQWETGEGQPEANLRLRKGWIILGRERTSLLRLT